MSCGANSAKVRRLSSQQLVSQLVSPRPHPHNRQAPRRTVRVSCACVPRALSYSSRAATWQCARAATCASNSAPSAARWFAAPFAHIWPKLTYSSAVTSSKCTKVRVFILLTLRRSVRTADCVVRFASAFLNGELICISLFVFHTGFSGAIFVSSALSEALVSFVAAMPFSVNRSERSGIIWSPPQPTRLSAKRNIQSLSWMCWTDD